jgi:hypothetical protein
MSDLYEKLKEQARESQKRWDKIDKIINHMKSRYKSGEDLLEDDVIECLELLMLNLRPATNVEAELAGLEASLFSLEKFIGKGK